MTSRFGASYPVLNGPHSGMWIDAPSTALAGSGVAMGWNGPRGMQYAVYVLVAIPPEVATARMPAAAAAPETTPATEPEPTTEPTPEPLKPKKLGLAFMRSWPTAAEAQQHVHEISLVTHVAREVAKSN